MKTTQKQIETILDIGRQLTAGASLDDLLHRIVAAATTLTETEAAGILLLDESGNRLRYIAATLYKDRLLDISVPIEGSIAGAAFTSGKPVVVSDVTNESRYYERVKEAINYKVRSLLAVPLQYKERKIGVLEIENKYADLPFDESDVEILTLLASQATVAIENVRLYQAAQQELAERTRAETELRQHRDHLSELVKERTTDLQTALSQAEHLNQQLHLQISERERLINDLKTFSSTVAHDIKGPLGTILGYSELIARDAEQAGLLTLSEWGGEVGVAVLKIGKIVDALLLLTRVRQQDVAVSKLEMGPIVLEAERRLAKLIEQTQAEISAPDKWPTALGYGPWIEEVWVNYINNAIEYGGNPPKIELGAQPVINSQTGAGEVRFWVRDNGKGLSPENQARLFVELERLGQSRSTGNGLGLSIVKRIIIKMGGQVGVQSVPGQGSEFFFTLPAFK
jgi:signal transduction histidine kinase